MKRAERRAQQCIHHPFRGERCDAPTIKGRANGWLCKGHDAHLFPPSHKGMVKVQKVEVDALTLLPILQWEVEQAKAAL